MSTRTISSRQLMLAVCLAAALLLSACSNNATPFIPPTQAQGDAVATIVAATLAAQPPSVTPLAAVTDSAATPTGENPLPDEASPTPTSLPSVEATTVVEATTPTPTMVPLPSPTPVTGDPRLVLGSPTFTDAMADGSYWPTDEDDYSAIEFADGALFFKAKTGTDAWRLLTSAPLQNFYLEVSAAFEACSGSDHYGLIVRVPDNDKANQGYLFGIDCDGRFSISEWDGEVEPDGNWVTHVPWKVNPAILPGAGEVNRLGVMATGDRLEFYVNGVKVGELIDSTFSAEGRVGLYVGSDETEGLRVKFLELSYWSR